MPLDLDRALANIKRVPKASSSQLDRVFFIKEHPEFSFLACIEPIHVYIIAQIAHHVGPVAMLKLRDAYEFSACFCGPEPDCKCETKSCPECPPCKETNIIPPVKIIPPPPPPGECDTVAYEKEEWTGQSSDLRDD